ncbi:MAG: hypothetical protein J7M38_01890, partial [Armatimonadetes bacterium]|nr:hypothetical protein [Armatimonadota bacterium]
PITLTYPQPASMQWFAYWGTEDRRSQPLEQREGYVAVSGWRPDRSDAAGLYWAAEDGEFYWKRFHVDGSVVKGQLEWWIENIPPVAQWPIENETPAAINYQPPYRNVIAVFTGDWQKGAEIYRQWAQEQIWCRRGTADDWPEETPEAGSDELVQWVPPWFRKIGFWAKFYHEPAKILPEWAAYRKWLRVPVASHWYRYSVATFNDNDPEYLPGDPYLLEGVRDARDMGVRPLPYVLSTIWDTDTQSWIREGGAASAMIGVDGKPYQWLIGRQVFEWMCPYTEQWRAKIRETCGRLILEHGMSGVYLDVLAAGSAKGCYNPEHGHPLHGGNYQFDGNRRLMSELRACVRRLRPDAAFFTEEIDEVFNDLMDGYLTLDLTRNNIRSGQQVWPIWTAVYHPWAINFGSDANLTMEPDVFGVIYGTQFIWGSQPLQSITVAPEPEDGDPTSEMFRDFTRAYYVAGRRFLMGGRWLPMAVRPPDAAEGRCGLELVADRHTVAFELAKKRGRIWTGPAVLGSAWRRQGDTGIVLANITEREQTVELTVRIEALGIDEASRLVRTWPLRPQSVGEAAGTHELTLPARTAAVYVITTDVDRTMQAITPLDDTPWELLAVEKGRLGSVTGPAGTLWACSDGPVVNINGEKSTTATPYYYNEDGKLQPREGRQADPHGPTAEGRPLPRELARRPFALLRRLPHTVSPGEGGVLVLSGDEHHLSCVAPSGTEISFAAPGLVIVSDPATGRVVRGLSEEPTARVTLPEGEGDWVVGYARFEPEEMRDLLHFGDEDVTRRVSPWANRLMGIASAEPKARAAELAAAGRQFVELVRTFDTMPGALEPGGPVARLHRRLQALTMAQLAARVELTAMDRWLSPSIPKPMTVMLLNATGLFDRLAEVEMVAVGDWKERGMTIIGGDARTTVTGASRAFSPTVTLDDGLYVERMIPVVACARIRRDGLDYCLADILRLEANRPYEIKADPEPVVTVAGAEAFAEVKLRNWSPNEVAVSFRAEGPEGWRVEPDPANLKAPGLAYSTLKVRMIPPADTPRGRYQIKLTANHTEDEDKAVYAFVPVNVQDTLEPVITGGDWPRPEDDQLAHSRRAGTFALYAEQDEAIEVHLSNVRVTHYVDTMTYQLYAPDRQVLAEGRVKVDESDTIEVTAPLAGTCYLSVTPKNGSAVVTSPNRYLCEVATVDSPLRLFCSEITRYFFVPDGSGGFTVAGQDGGPTETARVVITSPTGRVALDRDGNWGGSEWPVEVRPDEAAKIWTIRIEPVQDVSVWLSGDVAPYLATAPERVLAPVRK